MRPHGGFVAQMLSPAYPGFLMLYAALIVLVCKSQQLYRTPKEVSAIGESTTVLKAVGLATALFVMFVFASGNKEISRVTVAYAGVLNACTLAGWRYAKRWYVLRRVSRGECSSRVLIVGAGPTSRALAAWLEANRHLGYSVCGFVDPHRNGDARVLGSLSDFRRVALEQFVDQVFVALPADREVVKEIFVEARRLRLDMNVVPDLYDGLGWHAPMHAVGGFPVLELHGQPIPAFGLAAKRVLDVLLGIVGFGLSLPIVALAALWIRSGFAGAGVLFGVAYRKEREEVSLLQVADDGGGRGSGERGIAPVKRAKWTFLQDGERSADYASGSLASEI